jgi:heat shock protein HslJ
LLVSTANGVLTYNSTPVQDQSQELQDVTWYLVSAGTRTAVAGSNATTLFASDGRTVSGNTGCNEFNGSYLTEPGNVLTISGFSSTRAACTTDDLASQEEAMLIFLQSATGYTIRGNALQIQTVDGSVMNYTSIPPATPGGPSAVISGPTEANTAELMTFDGSGSLPMGSPIATFSWNMGDGTVLSGPAISYSYDTAGSYNVQLTVTDRAGNSDTASMPVQIYPVVEVDPPTAVLEGPSTAFVGESVTLSAANSTQGTAAIVQYEFASGDGDTSGPMTADSYTTIYGQPGLYYPAVTVTDAGDLNDTASMAITINARLEGTEWILSETVPGTSIDIVFRNNSIAGFGGCNNYSGNYTSTRAAGPTNQIEVGPISGSQRVCSEEIMAQEQVYLSSLQTATSYTISGTSLTLTLADGSQLVYYASVAVPAPLPAQ